MNSINERSVQPPSWLENLMFLERHANDGSPNRLSFVNGPSAGYSPRFGLPDFEVPLVTTPAAELEVYGDNRSNMASMCRTMNSIPIHPDSIGYYFADGREFSVRARVRAVPSASGRTLLVADDYVNSLWLKLSYPGVLGRFGSGLDRRKVQHSLAVCNILTAESIPHLAERSGLVMLGGAMPQLGCIFRDVAPSCVQGEIDSMVPLFSLLSRYADEKVDLWGFANIDRQDPKDTTAWLLDNLIFPLLESYWNVCVRTGLMPEMHAQNILLARQLGKVLIVYRDCQGFVGDPEYLRSTPMVQTISESRVFEERSRRYDDFMSQYVLMPLILRSALLGTVSVDQLLDSIRAATADLAPRNYFGPRQEWYEMPLEQPMYGRRIEYVRRTCKPPLR
ncbi:hypothetical protein [Nocardiopsis sp. FR4]|uniref:hypothetical protein n=1 Tax=Nocardiopsis sp. FR4 TaxID=2605985 RepID=UPI001359F46A|nr:hypothetical protein [Nocardiopsis sp. FR4]